MSITTENPDAWHDDLLERKADAEALIDFISSASRYRRGDDYRALVMAVDAEYGVGKTFFLKRLAQQMKAKHPVAFVDAWTDDIADEPLVAITATLQAALAPHLGKAKVKTAFDKIVAASGEIIKIGALGAAKRVAGLAITAGATELIEQTIKGLDADQKQAAGDVVAESTKDALDAAQGVIADVAPDKLMRDRIATFRDGQKAIENLKKNLSALVSSLDKGGVTAPIVIIIDELDRCRPTYAVKLLEEIKHLFDVDGLVFLLGTNIDQLARSVKALYGHEFDGSSYLRRFVGRRYRLRVPTLVNLFRFLLNNAPDVGKKLEYPHPRINDRTREVELPALLAHYMSAYDLHARDAFQVFDRLTVAARLTKDVPLFVPYILPLIIGDLKGVPRGSLAAAAFTSPLGYLEEWYDEGARRELTVSLEKLWRDVDEVAKLDELQRSRVRNQERFSLGQESYFRFADWAEARRVPLANPSRYLDLLDAVGAFDEPTQT